MIATAMCFTIGLSNVIPQAYGAKQFRLIGIYKNRMQIVVTILFLPLYCLLLMSKRMFLAMGQSEVVASLAY
jgi:Na+-driven multidrug efflux pump